MFVKNIEDCPAFTANDGCQIREWLHPDKDAVDLPYSVAMAVVAVGQQSYKHVLDQAEVYLISQGTGIMHIDEEEQVVGQGDSVFIPAKCVQWIENTGDVPLQFLALVSPPWNEADDKRLE
ncbi:MAG: cupin domain-containing protein [Gammaproteobacteria bacterium]